MQDDDYLICRCEDVSLARVQGCIEEPGVGPTEVKRRLRVGMGWCQGRICGPLLAELLGTDEFLDRRRVLRPVTLATVAGPGPDQSTGPEGSTPG